MAPKKSPAKKATSTKKAPAKKATTKAAPSSSSGPTKAQAHIAKLEKAVVDAQAEYTEAMNASQAAATRIDQARQTVGLAQAELDAARNEAAGITPPPSGEQAGATPAAGTGGTSSVQ